MINIKQIFCEQFINFVCVKGHCLWMFCVFVWDCLLTKRCRLCFLIGLLAALAAFASGNSSSNNNSSTPTSTSGTNNAAGTSSYHIVLFIVQPLFILSALTYVLTSFMLAILLHSILSSPLCLVTAWCVLFFYFGLVVYATLFLIYILRLGKQTFLHQHLLDIWYCC